MQYQDNYLVLASILYYYFERGIKPATGILGIRQGAQYRLHAGKSKYLRDLLGINWS
jgi:hypothetical protein